MQNIQKILQNLHNKQNCQEKLFLLAVLSCRIYLNRPRREMNSPSVTSQIIDRIDLKLSLGYFLPNDEKIL
jgi:hypothetical protein